MWSKLYVGLFGGCFILRVSCAAQGTVALHEQIFNKNEKQTYWSVFMGVRGHIGGHGQL
jgi:hypothetical protein